MGNYKLIALDMDGTLLNPDSQISAANRRTVRHAAGQGVHVVLSTGRGMPNILEFAEDLALAGPIIAVNGSEIWSNPKTLWQRHLLDGRKVMGLKEIADREGVWFWAYAVSGLYNQEQWPGRPLEEEWLKFGYFIEDDLIRETVKEEIASWDLEMTNSHPQNIELNPPGVSKAAGLREVCGILGVKLEECVAVGDSLNDISMIRAAGLGVAMGNAQDEVKQAADELALSNEQDGVAELIERLFPA